MTVADAAQTVLSVATGLIVLWLLLVLILHLERRPRGQASLRSLLPLAPDVIRLSKGLVTDPMVPRRLRISFGILLISLTSPIDLIPQFIPVLGFLDDALTVAIALRSRRPTRGPFPVLYGTGKEPRRPHRRPPPRRRHVVTATTSRHHSALRGRRPPPLPHETHTPRQFQVLLSVRLVNWAVSHE